MRLARLRTRRWPRRDCAAIPGPRKPEGTGRCLSLSTAQGREARSGWSRADAIAQPGDGVRRPREEPVLNLVGAAPTG